MAGKANSKTEVFALYQDVFDEVKKSLRNSSFDEVWASHDPDDPDDPVAVRLKKWDGGLEKNSTAGNFYRYMFTPDQVQRRIKVAVKYEQTAFEKLQGRGDMKSFRPVWLLMASQILDGGYDAADRFSDGIMAAAVWILDELSLSGRLEDLFPYIADACEYDCSDFLPYSHPSYDTELISAVINTIRHRNDDLYKPDQFRHSWTDPWTASSLRDVSVQSKKRENFEGMMALLDSQTVRDAMQRYENKVWEFFGIAYQIDDAIQRKVSQCDREIALAEEKLKAAYRNRFAGLAADGGKAKARPVLSPLMMPVSQPDQALRGQEEIDRLTEEKERLIRRKRQLEAKTMADISTMSYVSEREKYAEEWKGIVPDRLLNDLVVFSVDDPFESCFALLALLDKNSDIPWLYYGSVAVFYTILDQLPPTHSLYLSAGWPEPSLKRGAADERYQMVFKSGRRFENTVDSDGDFIRRDHAENLAQKIFAQTYTLLPRIRRNLPDLDLLLNEVGAESEREKEAYDLLLQVLWAKEDGNGLQEYRLLSEKDENPEETAQKDGPEESGASAEIAGLRQRISSLTRSYREEAAKVRNLQSEHDSLVAEAEDMRRELSELRNIVFNRENPDLEGKQDEPEVSFPYQVKSRTVSFGGHPSWLKSMKEYLPSVRFISPEMIPNTMLLRMADAVWIQPNCLSHSDYYRIMNVVREHKVKIHYYEHDSALKCAVQLAMKDLEENN